MLYNFPLFPSSFSLSLYYSSNAMARIARSLLLKLTLSNYDDWHVDARGP